jgi:hypothetical protein
MVAGVKYNIITTYEMQLIKEKLMSKKKKKEKLKILK